MIEEELAKICHCELTGTILIVRPYPDCCELCQLDRCLPATPENLKDALIWWAREVRKKC
jgi:hypothetical protein